MRWTIRLLTVLVILAAGGYIYWYFTRPEEKEEYATNPAKLKTMKEMAELATLDFHEEIAVKDNVDGKWIVARMTLDGSVKYDMEKVSLRQHGDTLTLLLPAEKFEILESTTPKAYEVIDTWDAERPVFGRKLTATEENGIKQRARSRLEATLRKRGYVERARHNATSTLTSLLRKLAPDSVTVVTLQFTD